MRKIKGVRISGIVATAPSKKVQNLLNGDEETRKLVANIGVEEKRVVENVLASDLCCYAAQKLLSEVCPEAESVDALLLVTQTPDFQIPSTSPIIAKRLGLKKFISCYDINQGCAGYVSGLELASSLVASGLKKVLLLVGDTPTRFLSPDDKSSKLLFGDGGSATLLELAGTDEVLCFESWADGTGSQDIMIKNFGISGRFPVCSLNERENYLILNGANVFSFAISQVPKIASKFFSEAGVVVGQTAFAFHQANRMINAMLEKKLGLDVSQVGNSIRNFGNTSSASIPISVTINKQVFKDHFEVCMIGFGVGLSINIVKGSLQRAYLEYLDYEA